MPRDFALSYYLNFPFSNLTKKIIKIDLTYTHITARPQNAQYFYILAFGNMFDQASINNLIKVDIARGEVVEGNEAKSIEKINLLLEDQKETAVIYTEQEELISGQKSLLLVFV